MQGTVSKRILVILLLLPGEPLASLGACTRPALAQPVKLPSARGPVYRISFSFRAWHTGLSSEAVCGVQNRPAHRQANTAVEWGKIRHVRASKVFQIAHAARAIRLAVT